MLSQGVGPVFCTLGEEYLAPPLAGPGDFREFITEPGRIIGERIRKAGGLRHIHCHGSIRDLLDDFGGYTFHGVMDRAEIARGLNALPAGLAPGARVVRPVARGEILSWDDVELDETSTVVKLRRMQDTLS